MHTISINPDLVLNNYEGLGLTEDIKKTLNNYAQVIKELFNKFESDKENSFLQEITDKLKIYEEHLVSGFATDHPGLILSVVNYLVFGIENIFNEYNIEYNK